MKFTELPNYQTKLKFLSYFTSGYIFETFSVEDAPIEPCSQILVGLLVS